MLILKLQLYQSNLKYQEELKTVFVKDNQEVKKGQKLFKIDTAKLKLDLSEQKTKLINN